MVHTKSSLHAASQAFFNQFSVSLNDRWGLCLSSKHVAGFSILVRSYFGGLEEPHKFIWEVDRVFDELIKNKVNILSLVPTQVFDLVKNGVRAPEDFKFLFVGGAFISPELISSAVDLGWPVVACYGSTETFAQMSFSSDGEFFKPYSGWKMRLTDEGELELKGGGLFKASIGEDGEWSLREESSWFKTGDLAEIDGEWFKLK